MIAQQDNLRYSERIKDTGASFHIEALAKKIRKNKDFTSSTIDADIQQREIEAFYKTGWEYEHCHANFSCDISSPLFMMSFSEKYKERSKYLCKYQVKVEEFIKRYKIEHEAESAFQIDLQEYREIDELRQERQDNLLYGRGALRSTLNAIDGITLNMKNNFSKLLKQKGAQEASEYWKIIDNIKIISLWIRQENGNIQQFNEFYEKVYTINPQLSKAPRTERGEAMIQFVANFISIFERVMEEKKSAIITNQPEIGKLTYLVHPILVSIYGNYEKQLKKEQFCRQPNTRDIPYKQMVRGLPLVKDIKHHNISKVVFINLDGYQSEYNIQFAKNMYRHLMYVSFPKFTNSDEVLGLRFFKKMLFKFTRDLYQNNTKEYNFLVQESDIDDYLKNGSQSVQDMINNEYDYSYNPDAYYKSVDNLYSDKEAVHNAKNIYTLPVQFKYLRNQFSNIFSDKNKDYAIKYQSYFIRFLLKDFVGDDIKKFAPNVIIISYSGRLKLLNEHFQQLVQEMAAISERKCILFPNFTSIPHDNIGQQEIPFDEQFEGVGEQQPQYDNIINDNSIREMYGMSSKQEQQMQEQMQEQKFSVSIQLLNKFSIFLKMCSGTYNLSPIHEEQSLINKYKNSKVYSYALKLLKVFGEQSDNYRGRVSQLGMKAPSLIMNRGIQKAYQDVESAVPPFYLQLFETIHKIITSQISTPNLSDHHKELIHKCKQEYYDILTNNNQNKGINLDDPFLFMKLQISQHKYEQFVYLYLKLRDQIKEYNSVETPNKKDNISGYYMLELFNKYEVDGDKVPIPIFKHTEIIHPTSSQSHHTYFNVMAINHISLTKPQLMSYAGKVKINHNCKTMQKERVEMHPIQFYNQQNQIIPQISNFKAKVKWNYAQTEKYYILYWPTVYDYLQATLSKMLNIPYNSQISNEIYIAQVPTKKHVLKYMRVNTNEDYIPRTLTTNMVVDDKVYIFGGFYGREYNYLKLQNDISSMDMRNYDPGIGKVFVLNEKVGVYGDKTLQDNNSFIRPKAQLQLCQYRELTQNHEQVDGEKDVVMFGGVGQNYNRPFSLMSNYYYHVKFNTVNRRISSIYKRLIYNSIIVSNYDKSIRNRNSFEHGYVYDRDQKALKQIKLHPNYEVYHRFVYSINEGALLCKMKCMFASPPNSICKGKFESFAYKIGQLREDENRQNIQSFLLSYAPEGNHLIVIKQKNEVAKVKIHMQVQENNKFERVALTHGSIISIDFKSRNIYAIVRHSLYTRGKYYLTHCAPTFSQEADIQVNLRKIYEFDGNMSQYLVLACRPRQLLIVHGLSYEGYNMCEFVMKLKKEQQQTRIQKIRPIQIDNRKYHTCYSFYYKDENPQNKGLQLVNYNFVTLLEKKEFCVEFVCLRLKLNNHFVFEWQKQNKQQIYYKFIQGENQKIVYIAKVMQLRETSENKIMIKVSNGKSHGLVGYLPQNNHNVIEVSQSKYKKQWEEGTALPYRIKDEEVYESLKE